MFTHLSASGSDTSFHLTNGYTAIHHTALMTLDLLMIRSRYFFKSSMLILLGNIFAVVEDILMPARYGGEQSTLSIGTHPDRVMLITEAIAGDKTQWRKEAK